MQLNAAFKGYPSHLAAIDLKDASRQGWQLLRGERFADNTFHSGR